MYELLHQCSSDQEAMQAKIDKLVELDEMWRKAFYTMVIEQERTKRTFDQKTKDFHFEVGEIVLLWDKNKEKPENHGKLEKIWLVPYQVSRVVGKWFVWLETLDGEELEFPCNGWILKHYFPLDDWAPSK